MSASARAVNSSAATQVLGAIPIAGRYPRMIKAGKAGSHSDGGGLILRLNGKGSANWLHRYQMNGKRRDMGLGSYPIVSLADARAKVAEARKLIADGKAYRQFLNPGDDRGVPLKLDLATHPL